MTVSFEVSREISVQIMVVATRYAAMYHKATGREVDMLSLYMDLTACHANGCPVDWERLYAADDFAVAHDVGGIYRYINRDTGKLEDCFVPRYAIKL